MEPDTEGNDNALMHLTIREEMKTNSRNENQLTNLDLAINRSIEFTGESIRNIHELRKYDALEGVDTGKRVNHN